MHLKHRIAGRFHLTDCFHLGNTAVFHTNVRDIQIRKRFSGAKRKRHDIAAMAAALLIERYHPDLIINAGVAGCFEEVPIGTLVLAEDFIQHDVDTTGVGDPIGLVSTVNKVSFPTADFDRARAAMDKTGYAYRTGRVATGDWFALPGERVNFIRDTFSPLLCEMEGGAVAQVCYRCGVPMMAIKSVSDCLVVKQDYYFNFPMAMADLNKAVMAFVDALKEV